MSQKTISRRSNIFLGERHVAIFNRLMAKSIDFLIVVAVYFLCKPIWGPLGMIAALLFCGFQDSMWVGQSIGKRIMGLRVVEDQMGLPCNGKNSLLRNLPFMLVVPLAAVPVLWVFFVLIGLPIIALELYLVLSLDTGVRLGDVLGNTLVVEYLDDALANT